MPRVVIANIQDSSSVHLILFDKKTAGNQYKSAMIEA
jgi:hypothetical protein